MLRGGKEGGVSLWVPARGIWTPEKSKQLPHQVTTANIGACYPFMAQGSLGTRGVYIGQDLYGAGGFCSAAWELYALIESTLKRGLHPSEISAIDVALQAATEQAAERGVERTLDLVSEWLIHPKEGAAEHLGMERSELLLAGRDAALTLVRLCEGDLAGMFDGETSPGIDFTAPLVSLDMSALYQSEALGILMICAQARIQRALMADRSVRRILVIDEGWAVLSNLAVARWLQYSIKMARATGVQVILIIHRLSDLTAAGAPDSEQVQIAKGMLSDTETQVIFTQSTAEVQRAKELLQLNTAQAETIPDLNPHVALWRVGRQNSEVRHRLLTQDEAWIVDTDQLMAA